MALKATSRAEDVVLDSGDSDVAYCVNPGRASTLRTRVYTLQKWRRSSKSHEISYLNHISDAFNYMIKRNII